MYLRIAACTCLAALASAASAQPEGNVVNAAPIEIQDSRLESSTPQVTRLRVSFGTSEADGVAGIARELASLHVAEAGARSFTNTVALRGMVNTPLFGDPAVTMYLDELPLGSAFTFPTELVGVDSAELNRGLGHNTRVGRAGTGGVLRLFTPEAEGQGGSFRASYGNYSLRSISARAAASTPKSDAFVAAGYSARDGFIHNQVLGRDVDWRESSSAMARFRFEATDVVDLSLLLLGQHVRDGVQPLVPLGGPLFEVQRGAEGVTPLDTFAASLSAKADVSAGELVATTSYSRWKLGPASNVLGLDFGDLGNESRLAQRSWTQEIRLASEQGGERSWLAGVFAMDADTDGGFTRSVFGQTFEMSSFTIEHRSTSAFGEYGLQVAPSLRLTAGLRVEANWKDLDRTELVPASSAYQRSSDSTALLPRVALTYQLDAQTQADIAFGSSYKPGGFSAFTGNRALARFGPERSQGVDTGVTRSSRDGAFSATLRGYAYRIEGYQIERSFQTGAMADDYLVINAERARSLGGELEVSWSPLPGLSISGSAGYSHATLRDFTDPYTGAAFAGNRVPYVPAHEFSLRTEYRSRGWFVAAHLVNTGRTYFTEAEDPTFEQRGYTVLGARIGFVGERLSISAFGENLTDREYYSAIIPGTFHATPGTPRTYGLELEVRF